MPSFAERIVKGVRSQFSIQKSSFCREKFEAILKVKKVTTNLSFFVTDKNHGFVSAAHVSTYSSALP